MDPKYINNGTYGCVFKPAIGCDKKTNNRNISKLFSSKTAMYGEKSEHEKINNDIDPTNIFTLKMIDQCDIQTNKFPQSEISKCKNFSTNSQDPPNNLHQLIYEYGGYDLSSAATMFDFKSIFFASKSVFKGLVIM